MSAVAAAAAPADTCTRTSLRKASPADAASVHALTQICYEEYRHSGEPSSVAQERADDLQMALLSGAAEALIAERAGTMTGSVRHRLEDEGKTLYFFRLGVRPDARGEGIARQLVAALEAEARRRGATRLRCIVRLNVARNVSLYESSGFAPAGKSWLVRRGEADVPTGAMEKAL